MKDGNRLLTASLAVVTLAAFNLPANAQAQKGWALYMTSPHTGVWYVYLSKNGMAAVNKKMGATLVTKAPQWNVVLYNDKTKVYYLSTLEQWQGSFQQGAGGGKNAARYKQIAQRAKQAPPRKGKTGMISGLPSTQYITDTPIQGSGAKRAEFWVTTSIEVPPQASQILSKTMGYSVTAKGMPLKVAYIDETGKRIPVVDCLKAQQQNIPAQSFTYPPSYTQVDNEVAVFMDEKGRKAMANIMDDLGGADGTDELSALLGEGSSTTKTRSPYGTRYGTTTAGRTYGNRTTMPAVTTRPTTAAAPAQQKPAQQDWWGNLFNAFGQKK